MSEVAQAVSQEPAHEPAQKQGFLRRNIEVVLAILLGLVSIATAYASFQGSLYGGAMTQSYTIGSNLATEAESLYLEGNQQYVQDAQLYDRLTDLQLDIANPDSAISAAAEIKYDTIYFQSVSENLDAAIRWADEQNAADPDLWYSPLDNEDYLAGLFGGYQDTKDEADATIANGDEANALGDRLTLATVIMAIALFLLGISAVVRNYRMKLIMASFAMVIFIAAAAFAASIPMLTL